LNPIAEFISFAETGLNSPIIIAFPGFVLQFRRRQTYYSRLFLKSGYFKVVYQPPNAGNLTEALNEP